MGTAEIAAGLACGVAAAACYELGYVAQAGDARAAGEAEGDRPRLLLRLARRRAWLGGTALVACGLLLQLLALHLAPLSVVQPALVLGLGLLVVLAERRLGERLGHRGRLAVAAAAAGVLLIALGGDSHAPPAAGHPASVLAALAAVALAVLVVAHARRRARLLVLAAGLGEAWAVIAAKVAVTDLAAGTLASAAGWGVAAGAAGLLALNAEMTGLQRVPATIAGPLVLVTQAAVPVLLAPAAVGERWASPPAVLGGLVLVVAAAVVLGGARVAQVAAA
jgi:drug/metabolite transporter (DMT)-like permease